MTQNFHLLFRLFPILFLFPLSLFGQCFQIESILVDACGAQEGLNEMVRFKVGATPLNTNNLVVSWPNNAWQGVLQNATTASRVSALNADVSAAGGCGQILEPIGNMIPANAEVILVTSYNLSTALNAFGPISEDYYMLFQNNPTTATGHFANFGTGIRTLSMTFGGGCSDVVSYNRALLVSATGANIASDGATVVFDSAGNATYTNNGCQAPVPPFAVNASPATASGCPGASVSLNGSAQGYQSIQWSAASGTFANANQLNTTFTIPNHAVGSITLTLTAINSCGQSVTDTVLVNVSTGAVPDFSTTLSLCNGATAPTLNSVSPNGISGIWSPAVISNTTNGVYVFTPNAGQCAASVTLNVAVSTLTTPNFATNLSLCNGASAPTLNSVSPNGISGIWSPSTINNTANGVYLFTPNAGQCAASVTLNVAVSTSITPNFATNLSLCNGATAPTLNSVSPNGISGIWSPAAISNTTNGAYLFTPNAGQCAASVTLNVAVSTSITPNFATNLSLCNGATAPILNSVSPNGISGIWSPAAISNTTNGAYVFTPNAGQCAASVTLNVAVSTSITPNFATNLSLCNGATAPTLNSVSPNGISGIWSPAAISNTANGVYVFTPNAGQCAASVTLNVAVSTSITPNFATTLSLCNGSTAPTLNSVSPNGILGIWSPSTISNTANGVYVFAPNAGQCAASVTLNVAVSTLTTPNFATHLSLCNGASVPTLNSVSPNGISGIWSPAAISNTANGVYVFTPNAGQCAASVTLNVAVDPLPQPRLDDAVICLDENGATNTAATLYCGINDLTYQYQWRWNGSLLASNGPTHLATDPGIYEVTVTTAAGCTATATATVGQLNPVVAQINTSPDFEQQTAITVQASGGSGQYTFTLDNGAAQSHGQFYNVMAGDHELVVRDTAGCSVLTLQATILDYPKFFTPNADGYHDFWNIPAIADRDGRIAIFDRYGKLLKMLKAADHTGWDGTYNGNPLPSTDYWFELSYRDTLGNPKTFSAHFALKR